MAEAVDQAETPGSLLCADRASVTVKQKRCGPGWTQRQVRCVASQECPKLGHFGSESLGDTWSWVEGVVATEESESSGVDVVEGVRRGGRTRLVCREPLPWCLGWDFWGDSVPRPSAFLQLWWRAGLCSAFHMQVPMLALRL